MTAQRYVHDILQPHVLPLMQEPFFNKKILGLTQQGCHKIVSALLLPFLSLPDPQIYHQSSISGIICRATNARESVENPSHQFGEVPGVHYRLFSVWTLVPVRLDKQLSDHSTVDEITSGAADCRLTYTMANCPQRRLEKRVKEKKEGEREKEGKESSKRRGLVVLGNGEENPRVLFRDADQESKTRMRNNALRTGPRQAVE
ncbi:hypothetical protein TNCV_3707541 [Trichonephila clavipes]|nr:hypothetical protein TNCV_3707541 [Trichonephila clavipes]